MKLKSKEPQFRDVLYHAYFNLRKLQECFQMASYYIETNKHNSNNLNVAFSYLIIGQLYLTNEKFENALENLEISEQIFNKIGFEKNYELLLNISKSKTYLKLHKFKQANKYNNKITDYYKSNKPNKLNELLHFYDESIEINFKSKNYSKLVSSYENWLKIYHKINGEDNHYQFINRAKIQLETSLKEQELDFINPTFNSFDMNLGKTDEIIVRYSTRMDYVFARQLVSILNNPSQEALKTLLNKTKKVKIFRLFEEERNEYKYLGRFIDKEISGWWKLREFKSKIIIEESQPYEEAVYPIVIFCLYNKQDEIGQIQYLGNNKIRISHLWKNDAELTNDKFEKFLEGIGIKPNSLYIRNDNFKPIQKEYYKKLHDFEYKNSSLFKHKN